MQFLEGAHIHGVNGQVPLIQNLLVLHLLIKSIAMFFLLGAGIMKLSERQRTTQHSLSYEDLNKSTKPERDSRNENEHSTSQKQADTNQIGMKKIQLLEARDKA